MYKLCTAAVWPAGFAKIDFLPQHMTLAINTRRNASFMVSFFLEAQKTQKDAK